MGVTDPGPNDDLRRFLSSTGATNFPHVADKGRALRERFKVDQSDAYLLIDENDRVLFRGDGAEIRDLGQALARLAASSHSEHTD
ncbi:hypothetical protein [Streptomyces sp. NPDC101145]|uniref:hypothetical protein n=1 Tax=Streptomyces sp. NPDC101145 TaxID=3366112 RepID=UPI00381E1297